MAQGIASGSGRRRSPIKMARKPNYRFERHEREKAKAAKKAARLEAKKERAEKRQAEADGPQPTDDESGSSQE